MTTNELISIKIQEVLGGKYKVLPFSFFAKNYIQPLATPYGKVYDINYQAFEEMQDTIPVCVNLQETSPINSDIFYRTGILTLQFYVPVDAFGRKGGKGFDFFGDYERLRAELTNGQVALVTYRNVDETPGQETVDKIYKAYFSIAEPTTDGAVQSTGAYRRMVFTVQGNVTVIDEHLLTGDAYGIEIYNGRVWLPFTNITNLVISRDEQGNSVQAEGTTAAQTPPVSRVHSISFVVYDRDDDAAVTLLRRAILIMGELIVSNNTAARSQAQRREMMIRIKNGATNGNPFWALMTVSYNASGATSVGSYSVSLTRTDDVIQTTEE